MVSIVALLLYVFKHRGTLDHPIDRDYQDQLEEEKRVQRNREIKERSKRINS